MGDKKYLQTHAEYNIEIPVFVLFRVELVNGAKQAVSYLSCIFPPVDRIRDPVRTTLADDLTVVIGSWLVVFTMCLVTSGNCKTCCSTCRFRIVAAELNGRDSDFSPKDIDAIDANKRAALKVFVEPWLIYLSCRSASLLSCALLQVLLSPLAPSHPKFCRHIRHQFAIFRWSVSHAVETISRCKVVHLWYRVTGRTARGFGRR